MQKREACTKQRVFLAETPMGPMLMVYREAPNAGFAMAQLMASSNAFDKFYVESIGKMAGVDITKAPPGPPPHLVFEFVSGKPGKASTMIAAPVPDAAKFWKMCREMTARTSEHRESRERSGITLERAFYLHDAKMAVVYLEGDDPVASMEKAMASTAAYDKWFTGEVAAVHGMDMSAKPPPKPELLHAFDA
jgi:hypothetical protein